MCVICLSVLVQNSDLFDSVVSLYQPFDNPFKFMLLSEHLKTSCHSCEECFFSRLFIFARLSSQNVSCTNIRLQEVTNLHTFMLVLEHGIAAKSQDLWMIWLNFAFLPNFISQCQHFRHYDYVCEKGRWCSIAQLLSPWQRIVWFELDPILAVPGFRIILGI